MKYIIKKRQLEKEFIFFQIYIMKFRKNILHLPFEKKGEESVTVKTKNS